MRDFVAIDFETANECASSVCSIGAVLVRNRKIVKTFYSLIRPEPDYYKWFCQQVHGLGHEDTDDAEVFPFVWKRMTEELLEGIQILSEDTADCPDALPLVAHNAGFDSRCLREVFRCYRMDYPEFVFHDTLAASRRHFCGSLENHQLQTVAAACGYDLMNHHHALADAEACAWIARRSCNCLMIFAYICMSRYKQTQ